MLVSHEWFNIKHFLWGSMELGDKRILRVGVRVRTPRGPVTSTQWMGRAKPFVLAGLF